VNTIEHNGDRVSGRLWLEVKWFPNETNTKLILAVQEIFSWTGISWRLCYCERCEDVPRCVVLIPN